MGTDSLIKLFERDLKRLKKEIESFTDEANLWKTKGTINNPPGNLCLHLCGNLKYFVGTTLGNSGYIRDREKEFSDKNIPVAELIRNIESTHQIVIQTLQNLSDEDLAKTYPINVFNEEMTTDYFLFHLTTHLNYHLGQINYFRRMI